MSLLLVQVVFILIFSLRKCTSMKHIKLKGPVFCPILTKFFINIQKINNFKFNGNLFSGRRADTDG